MNQETFRSNFVININVLEFDINDNLNEIILHHYLIKEMYMKCSFEISRTLKEIEKKTKLSFQQVRTSINKLEEKGIIEIEKGHGKKPNIYKYVIK